MLRSSMTVFIIKRLLILFVILSIIDIIWIGQRWIVLAGLSIGMIFSVLRFDSYAMVLKKNNAYGIIIVFIINQVVLLPLLFIALKLNQYFFTGTVAGILLVPSVLLINSITEAFSITNNNFE